MRRRPRLLVLVGPKGAGKTSIGRGLGEHPGVRFVDVERVAKRVLDQTGGVIDEHYAARAFEAIYQELCAREGDAATLVMETTGASDSANALLSKLRSRFDVVLVRILAEAALCDERMATRDQSAQIQVDSAMVRAMFERTVALDWPWALTVDNDGRREVAAIVADIARLIDAGLVA